VSPVRLPSRLRDDDRTMTATKTTASVRRLLIVLGAVYLASQLVLFSIRRPPSWDEVIYLSQVTPGMRAMMFGASRARGITLLVAPITIASAHLYTGPSLRRNLSPHGTGGADLWQRRDRSPTCPARGRSQDCSFFN